MSKAFLSNVNFGGNQLLAPVIENLASDPVAHPAGRIYYNTVGNQLMLGTGSTYIALATGSTAAATTGSLGTIQLAGDLGGTATSPTVVATHLASALPVSQGGSGAGTLTGILVGNGTSAFTAVGAPTGAIVGTSDTQTLTSKTLTSPTINAGALSGTFSGTPTFSGVVTHTAGIVSTIGTIVLNAPAVSATQTWNAAGVTFQGYFLNVTNTASAAGSRLIDLQSGSATMFNVDISGNTKIVGTITAGSGSNVITTAAGLVDATKLSGLVPVANGGTGVGTLSGIVIGNGTSAFTTVTAPTGAVVGTSDTQTLTSKTLTSPTINAGALSGTFSGAATFSGAITHTSSVTSTIGTVVADTPMLTGTQTWNAVGTTFHGIFLNVTNTTSAAASRLIDLQTGSSTMFNVDVSGNTKITGIITAGSGSNAITTAAGLLDATKVSGLLPVANGGTGIGTLTGIVVGNGTSAFSTVTAPTGTIVGTTDTQTLSAKTLTSPTINAGALSGTFSGTATFSGTITYTSSITSTTGSIAVDTPVLTATQTWNAAGVSFHGFFLNVTNTASAAGARLIDLQTASTTMFNVDVAGNTKITGIITAGSGSNAITTAAGLLDASKVSGLLPVANGGTGIGSLTGVVIGNGTSAFSTVTAPTGTIVGTTDTQTLSAKTLTTPTINGAATSGTFSGTPTFSGVVTFSAQPSVSGTSSATFQLNSNVQIKAASSTEMQIVGTNGSTLADLRVNNLYVNGELNEVAGTVITTGDAFARFNDAITVHGSNANAGITVKRLKTDDATLANVSTTWNETSHRWNQDITDSTGQTVYTGLLIPTWQTFTLTSGSNSYTVTHNLNNQYPVIQIIDASNNTQVEADITFTSTTAATIAFASNTANNMYAIVVG